MNVKTGMLKAASRAVTSKAGRQVLKLQKHSPVILLVGGTVGAVGSTVLACKATLKLNETTEPFNEQLLVVKDAGIEGVKPNGEVYTEKMCARDVRVLNVQKAVAVCKLYAPSVTLALVSYAALGGSHVILTRRNTGLMAAYATVHQGFESYRSRVEERYGPEVARELEIDTEVREVSVVGEDGKVDVKQMRAIKGDPQMYQALFDHTCSPWVGQPDWNMTFLLGQQAYHNNMLDIRGHVFLNEIYDDLGIDRTTAGAQVGWVKNPKDPNAETFIDLGLFDGGNYGDNAFVHGEDGAILINPNVQGVILDQI